MRSPSTEIILKIVHELIDQHCGRDGPISGNYVPDHWPDDAKFDSFRSTINQLIISNIDYKHGQTIKVTGDLPEEVKKSILEAVELRRAEIKSCLIGKIISSPSTIVSVQPSTIDLPLIVMKDFDWQVKLILASNLLTEINETLINLDLLLIKPFHLTSNGTVIKKMTMTNNQEEEEITSIEMDKSEIRQLIDKLEELMDKLDR